MKVAKFVMSSATDDTSAPETSMIFTAICRDAWPSCSRVTACNASQNRRPSSAEALRGRLRLG